MALTPASILPDDKIRITTFCYDPTTQQLGLNVGYFNASPIGQVGTTTDTELADTFSGDYAPDIKLALCEDVQYRGVKVEILRGDDSPVPKWSAVGNGVGSIDDDETSPNQICGLIHLLTDFAGRGGRGRKYTPFVPKGEIDSDNRLTGEYVELIEPVASWWGAPWAVTLDIRVQNFHPQLRHVDDEGLVHWRPIQHYTTDDYAATQRRRSHWGRTNTVPAELPFGA